MVCRLCVEITGYLRRLSHKPLDANPDWCIIRSNCHAKRVKKILFSAIFGAEGQQHRLSFLSNVLKAFPEPARFVAFNISGQVNADFEIVESTSRLKPQVGDSLDYLERILVNRFSDEAIKLMNHVRGEHGKNPKTYRANAYKLARMILQFEQTIDSYEPDYVYLWNQFNVFHSIAAKLLQIRRISYGFFHDGVLPGSIALDVDGEMGESWIAREPQRFLDVKVSSTDIARASNFLDRLALGEPGRYIQQDDISAKEALRISGLDDRPVILLAGQNDWHSGIKPRSKKRILHSHIFPGSTEALMAMDEVAGDLGVTILFKPHPGTKDKYTFLRQDVLKNSLVLSSVSMQSCLDLADAVMTIASQTCYVALIAGKPVIMLGKNQITGKGLTYDAECQEDIPDLIINSISDPLKVDRRRELSKHVAQLERCYLFDAGNQEYDFYRRRAHQAANYISASLACDPDDLIEQQIAGRFS